MASSNCMTLTIMIAAATLFAHGSLYGDTVTPSTGRPPPALAHAARIRVAREQLEEAHAEFAKNEAQRQAAVMRELEREAAARQDAMLRRLRREAEQRQAPVVRRLEVDAERRQSKMLQAARRKANLAPIVLKGGRIERNPPIARTRR